MHSVKKKMWLLPARINWWPEPAGPRSEVGVASCALQSYLLSLEGCKASLGAWGDSRMRDGWHLPDSLSPGLSHFPSLLTHTGWEEAAQVCGG